MSGALAGGVNEAAVAKLMKTLGPNNPDLVQMASAALGYATNKMIGEDGLAGATIAQWGTKWNLELDNHSREVRETIYRGILGVFKSQYGEMLARGNPYSNDEIEQAENDLTYVYHQSENFGLTRVVTELLGLFIEPEKKEDIIEHIEYIDGKYPIYTLNTESVLNKTLKNDYMLNYSLVKNAIDNTITSNVAQPTYVDSQNYYLRGLDAALAFGIATSIVTYTIDGVLIKAKITIIDNWDHDKEEADTGGFIFKDAYILQQSGRKRIFSYKTTYDVVFYVTDFYNE